MNEEGKHIKPNNNNQEENITQLRGRIEKKSITQHTSQHTTVRNGN